MTEHARQSGLKGDAAAPRRALIIGNSDGIGLAFTRRLLDAGWMVRGLSRSTSPVRHDLYAHVVVDVTDAGYRETLRRAVDQDGPFDVVTYAVGIGSNATLEDLTPDTLTLSVNLMGALHTAEVVVPLLVRARRGHLIVLSSLADELVLPGAEAYAASKAALSTYFLALGQKLRRLRLGVAISVVRFGFVNTKMARAPMKPFMKSGEWAAGVLMKTVRRRPLRVSRPWPMAALVRLLRWLLAWRSWLPTP